MLPAIHGFGCNGSALVLRSGGQVVQTLTDICIGDVYLFSGQSNIDLAESYVGAPRGPHHAGSLHEGVATIFFFILTCTQY